MATNHKIGAHATIKRHENGRLIRVTYHKTDVVQITPEGKITLDSGGWRTATTKARMNQAANEYGLDFQVFQKAGEWYVNTRTGIKNFYDGMEV